MQTYIIAVKRNSRNTVPTNWVNQLQNIPGVIIGESCGNGRIQIKATASAIIEVRKQLDDFAYVEPVILHDKN